MDKCGGEPRRKTILVVDDYEDVRSVMRAALEMFGYRVVEASSGEESVELARLELPDLILMDLSMPKLDGFAATQRIRRLAGLHDVPIIILSAHTSREFRADALAFGCSDFIVKPVQFDILRAAIERQLDSGDEDASETTSPQTDDDTISRGASTLNQSSRPDDSTSPAQPDADNTALRE